MQSLQSMKKNSCYAWTGIFLQIRFFIGTVNLAQVLTLLNEVKSEVHFKISRGWPKSGIWQSRELQPPLLKELSWATSSMLSQSSGQTLPLPKARPPPETLLSEEQCVCVWGVLLLRSSFSEILEEKTLYPNAAVRTRTYLQQQPLKWCVISVLKISKYLPQNYLSLQKR